MPKIFVFAIILSGIFVLMTGCAKSPAENASELPTNKAAVISQDLPDGGLAAGTAVLALEKIGDKWKVAPMSVGEPPLYWGDVDERYLSFEAADIAATSNYGIVKTETETYDGEGGITGSYSGAVLIEKRDGDMFQVIPGAGGPASVWIKAESVVFEWGD